ncbi:tRNA sulfurtransferase [Acrasis kona]|uniref:tRNA sulfurtransferase n=1 Tax=Acrasis kona TaxID=1008807 RepID=A0AAW2YY58_9EUKA
MSKPVDGNLTGANRNEAVDVNIATQKQPFLRYADICRELNEKHPIPLAAVCTSSALTSFYVASMLRSNRKYGPFGRVLSGMIVAFGTTFFLYLPYMHLLPQNMTVQSKKNEIIVKDLDHSEKWEEAKRVYKNLPKRD